MERAEAEAIYDAGREACVEVLLKLAGLVEQHELRLARLEERARRDSRNSSVPASADPPRSRQQRRAEAREKAKELARRDGAAARKAGGQDGHSGTGRELLAEDRVDELVDHFPGACGGCGHEFAAEEQVLGGRFGRHQTFELPPTAVLLSEHRTHRLRCPECRVRTTAPLPAGVSGSVFGPRLSALVVTLTARNRVSRRDMSELLRELLGIGMSVGSVDRICQRTAAVLMAPHAALTASVLDSPFLNADETGWRTAGQPRTLWTASTDHAAIFRIAQDRHRDRLIELIGEDYQGIVCSDRWWAYEHLDPETRQACWAHLKRDFQRHAEGLAEQKTFGEHGLLLTRRVFQSWHEHDEHQDRTRLLREIRPIQDELRTLLERAVRKSTKTKYQRRFAGNLLKLWPALWTFTTIPGVDPTNNAAERSLRGPVISRKLSHGTRTQDGERFIERALSASVTCRLQHRSLFDYLTGLLGAHAHGQPLPTLA